MPHQLSAALDHSLRLRYRAPSETLGLLGFAAGMTVLDLGCGTGLFTVDMARMVGANGVVHAVDIQAPLVEQTRQRILAAGLAERVRYAVGALELGPVVLVGHSMSGGVLSTFAGRHPDQVAGLVYLDAVGDLAVLPAAEVQPFVDAARAVADWPWPRWS